ncbi:MAG: hypothetical protein NWE92_06325 [Candidatus Bathyarchaeota archaeon]|nr:hypothetical protein [Candidatus Bathyarchaeota archaeon]
MIMEQSIDIPCKGCKLWNAQNKKFTCNPKSCRTLSEWMRSHTQKLSNQTVKVHVQLPQVASQYIV